jgi:hypothetical protein
MSQFSKKFLIFLLMVSDASYYSQQNSTAVVLMFINLKKNIAEDSVTTVSFGEHIYCIYGVV